MYHSGRYTKTICIYGDEKLSYTCIVWVFIEFYDTKYIVRYRISRINIQEFVLWSSIGKTIIDTFF